VYVSQGNTVTLFKQGGQLKEIICTIYSGMGVSKIMKIGCERLPLDGVNQFKLKFYVAEAAFYQSFVHCYRYSVH